ncbi:hypothetical protein [Planococcus sp. NCCP-2050]|uniref:hypothetical protein n=1 Tax=Planococcus sp. NCCP-2050 TaxID=2944679 RepID=UPI002040BC3B|nr:hypothetical protein [Planococcus sp. NCCP-2050]GKW47358.1 hypothetical protein NCCP2050_30500 [Planococcus sp. NCCP-2050]
MKESKEKFNRKEEHFSFLGLTLEQTRLLYSLQYRLVSSDIVLESTSSIRQKKGEWLLQWKETMEESLKSFAAREFDGKTPSDNFVGSEAIGEGSSYRPLSILQDSQGIIKLIRKLKLESQNLNTQFYLILLETTLFVPYTPLDLEDKNKYKKLKMNEKVVRDELIKIAAMLEIDPSFIDKYKSTYKSSLRSISGFWTKVLAGGIAGAIVIGITGGLAAPFVAGLAAPAGLAGAAAISAGLAALGGGAIAAGGFGMAGGIAVIVGGGTILGATSGTVAGALLSSSSDFTLQQAAKLEVVMKEIILFAQKDVKYAQKVLKEQQRFIEAQKLRLIELERNEKGNAEQIKILKKSLEYLKKVYNQNSDLIEGAISNG